MSGHDFKVFLAIAFVIVLLGCMAMVGFDQEPEEQPTYTDAVNVQKEIAYNTERIADALQLIALDFHVYVYQDEQTAFSTMAKEERTKMFARVLQNVADLKMLKAPK